MEMNNKLLYTIIILLIYISLLTSFTLFNKNPIPNDLGDWQAVFLSDGQVYFGKLQDYNVSYALLSQVYYLKYGNDIQQNSMKEEQSSVSEKNLNLIKLGGEAHGPEGYMYILKDKILFIEDLRSSSNIVKVISKNQVK